MVSNFFYRTGGNYIKNDYNILERLMLKLFDWDLNVPTAATFATYYSEFVINETDFNSIIDKSIYSTFDEFKNDVKQNVMTLIDTSVFGE